VSVLSRRKPALALAPILICGADAGIAFQPAICAAFVADAENPTDYCRIYRAAKESDAMDLGYARVSTREQDLTGQVAELQATGCAKIFSEKASGARGDRAELARVIKRLQPEDVLVVTRLDRLARSTAIC
jgi:hypothetical protein